MILKLCPSNTVLEHNWLRNIALIWRRHHYQRKTTSKVRHMLGLYRLWALRDLYRATPADTRGLGFCGLIWRTAPFNRSVRQSRDSRDLFQPGSPRGILVMVSDIIYFTSYIWPLKKYMYIPILLCQQSQNNSRSERVWVTCRRITGMSFSISIKKKHWLYSTSFAIWMVSSGVSLRLQIFGNNSIMVLVVKACLSLGTVSQARDVSHWPLVLLCYLSTFL